MPLDDLADLAADAVDMASDLVPDSSGQKKSDNAGGTNRVFWTVLVIGLIVALVLFS